VSRAVRVAIEATPKKAFATAVDWPGWSRSGKTAELALEVLGAYAPRYASVAGEAGETFPPGPLGTDASEADRLRRLVAAAWSVFDRVAASAPAELRKSPRGGGRDRDKMIGHVIEADSAYAREIGLRMTPPAATDRAAVEAMRAAVLEVIGARSDGTPIAGRKWTTRYAAHRIAWHALDHAWEMEDRSDPS
jgi:hypothetical protein